MQGNTLNPSLLGGYVLPTQFSDVLCPTLTAGHFSYVKLLATVNDNEQPVVIPSY